MSKDFDPYHIWLGIPPKDQPPHHFRLLGLELFEDDPEVIDAAANRQIAYLHKIASGPNRKQSQSLMNEIAVARRCLLTPDRHKEYVEKLRQQLSDSSTAADSATETDTADIDIIANKENSAVTSNAKNVKAIAAVVIALMLVVGGATTWILTRPDDKNASLIEGSTTGKASGTTPSPAIASAKKQNPSSQDGNGGQSRDMFSKLAPHQSDPGDTKKSRNKKKGKSRKGRNNNKGKSKKNKADNNKPENEKPKTKSVDPSSANEALVAHWKFDNKDSLGATSVGDDKLKLTLSGKPLSVEGPIGTAVKLDGKDDWISMPVGVINPTQGTFALWVRTESAAKAAQLLATDVGSGFYFLRVGPNGQLTAAVGKPQQRIQPAIAIESGHWYHVAMTWKSNGPAVLYCNGKQIGELKSSGKLSPPKQSTIGVFRVRRKSLFAAASIDDVRVYHRVLTAAEVTELANVPSVTLKAPQPLPVNPPTPVPSLPATFAATPTGINYALCEYWLQLKKNSPAELAKFIKNQTKPTGTRYYSKLAMSKDQSARGNWGQRVSGYLIPTVTGSYSFKPTFENRGLMYLSTNANPATKKPVRGKIKLTANRPYYFEIFHMGDGVNDSFRVDWTLPNGKSSPIPARHLAWSLHQVRFVTLGLSKITSTTDLKYKTQTDGSVLATKFDRKPTTITVEIQPQLSVITAFEFQAIPDASGGGPGYGSRGSFELSEFVVHPFDSDNAAATSEKIEFSESDSVANSGVARHSFDGKESTNWTFRGRGEMGRIILIPKKPIPSTKRRFQVTLKFKQNVGHFRIKATGMRATLLAAHKQQLKPPPVPKLQFVNRFVNLGGTKKLRDRRIEWIPSQAFSKGSWGHVGGRTQKSRTLKGTVLGSSIYGIREFRVAVPNGRYLVTLYFSETSKPKRNQRYFQFTIEGVELSVVDVEKLKEPLKIPKGIRVTDGVLEIRFEKRKEMGATPFLNAISIERRG